MDKKRRNPLSFAAATTAGLLAVLALCFPPVARGANRALAVVQTALHQYDGGPPVPASFEFFPGDIVFVTFRISGFHTVTNEDDQDRLQLLYTVEALDPEGVPLKETDKGAIAETLTRQDKKQKWLPLVRYETPIPPAAPPGAYRIVVNVQDKLNNTTAKGEIPFKVDGPAIEPSDTLALRNFHFYRTETAMQPLARPVYRPGNSVWARFDITGYKFGENNRFKIDYGIRVFRANGKLLFEQPIAAQEERESFYPERHIGGGLSLNLTKDLTPGEYTVIVIVHDRIGDQTYKEEHTFEVR